jgi:hypothetical protein
MPSPTTRLQDQQLYHRAVEAAIWAIPAVSNIRFRKSLDSIGARPNDVLYFSQPMDARHVFLTPNNRHRSWWLPSTRQLPAKLDSPGDARYAPDLASAPAEGAGRVTGGGDGDREMWLGTPTFCQTNMYDRWECYGSLVSAYQRDKRLAATNGDSGGPVFNIWGRDGVVAKDIISGGNSSGTQILYQDFDHARQLFGIRTL